MFLRPCTHTQLSANIIVPLTFALCIPCTRSLHAQPSILDNLAAGASPEEIRRDYPSVSTAAIRAAIAYAAELSHERVLAVPA